MCRIGEPGHQGRSTIGGRAHRRGRAPPPREERHWWVCRLDPCVRPWTLATCLDTCDMPAAKPVAGVLAGAASAVGQARCRHGRPLGHATVVVPWDGTRACRACASGRAEQRPSSRTFTRGAPMARESAVRSESAIAAGREHRRGLGGGSGRASDERDKGIFFTRERGPVYGVPHFKMEG